MFFEPDMAEAARRQTTETLQKLYDGKLRLERRNGASVISARTFLQGKLIRKSTGERTLHAATKIATDWYLDLRDRIRHGEDLHGKSFAEVAEAFLLHAELVREVSEGQRRNYRQKWNLLKDAFNGVKVANVDAKFLLTLREKRSQIKTRNGKSIKPATLKKDIDFVRLVLRHAKHIEKCLDELPEFPSFRGGEWEIVPSPRPFLDYAQWVKVRDLAKERMNEPDLNPRTRRQRHELYWFMLICVGAALRVGEAYSLRWKDCELIKLGDKDHTEAVHMKVLGKHSRGGHREEAYAMFGAVNAFKNMRASRPDAKPDDPLFLENHREGIKELLIRAGLRTDKEGRTRDSKSLRQTGISLRLDLGPNPDYRDIAKWARTSPAMIATFYDQTHPLQSVERIVGFRKREKSGTKKHANHAVRAD
jgi:integrase